MGLRSLCWFLPLAAAMVSCTTYDTSLLLDAPPTGGGGQGGEAGEGGEGGAGGKNPEGGSGGTGDAGGEAGQGGGEGGEGGGEPGGMGGEGGQSGGSGQGGAPQCSDPSMCDDSNECTTDTCDDGVCVHTSDPPPARPQTPGNCQLETCAAGIAASTADDTDLPPDDSNDCTVEKCANGAPDIQKLDGPPCQAGGKVGYCAAGVCKIDCSASTDCNDGEPCTKDSCVDGKCSFVPDDTATPTTANTPGDCKKPVCKGGVAATATDTTDVPTATDCQTAACSNEGLPTTTNKADKTPCTQGGDYCLAGACKANTCGDDVLFGSEDCDLTQLDGQTCENFGFGAGATGLKCSASCMFDPSGCKGSCGDGKKDAGEECDDPMSPGAPGNGCSKYCTIEPAIGELVITEIMINPNAPGSGNSDLGEFFELYNATSKAIDLRGLLIVSSGESVEIKSETPVIAPAGAYVVLAKTNQVADNGIANVLFAYGASPLSFSNTVADDLSLEVPTTLPIVIDKVTFKKSSFFDAASYSLNPTKLTAALNDDPTNWCASKTVFNTPDKGTPGAPNDACP